MRIITRDECLRIHEERLNFRSDFTVVPVEKGLWGDPWRLVAASILEKGIKPERFAQILRLILGAWQTPEELRMAADWQISDIIGNDYLRYRKVRQLRRMNKRWLEPERWVNALDLPGINQRGLLWLCEYSLPLCPAVPEADA